MQLGALLLALYSVPGILAAQSGQASVQITATPGSGDGTEKVTGIGGVFFRARDPQALARWYRDHLGVSLVPSSYEEQPWRQEAGPTVFAPFPHDTDYFGRAEQAWMVNFRDTGFARIHNPEGNPVELWEPQDPSTD